MAQVEERVRAVLDGYANFPRKRELALPKHQPYLVRWVRGFLHFARERDGYVELDCTMDTDSERTAGVLWWLNDYRFEWDVDLAGKLKPGANTVALRVNCVHHFGGMFRRPFPYQPTLLPPG